MNKCLVRTSSSGLLNRLIEEAPRPQCDVFLSEDPLRSAVLKKKGLSAPYQSPAAAGLLPEYSDPDHHWTGMSARVRVLLVNRKHPLFATEPFPTRVQDLADPREFMESLKVDLFEDEVFVFTPKGEVKSLAAGATPLDFAYEIHTDVGHRCVGAKVNGAITPLNTPLKNGDVVELITRHNAQPSLDWLEFTKSAHARSRIRTHFRKLNKNEDAARGRDDRDRGLLRQPPGDRVAAAAPDPL